MKVSSIRTVNSNVMYATNNKNKSNLNINNTQNLENKQGNQPVFKARFGRILGKVVGAGVGAAAGGAIIGGGSLAAGVALLSGPIGWAALGATYFVGGALAGGYVGDGFGDVIEDKINEKDKKNE